MIMRIVVGIAAILFGLLHTLAAGIQLKSKDPAIRGLAIAMACGGACVALHTAAHLAGGRPGWMDALSLAVDCLLICVPAYENGKRSGNFHPSHHIVRGIAALLLVAGIAVW